MLLFLICVLFNLAMVGNNSNNAVGKSCPSALFPVNETSPAVNSIAKVYLTDNGSLGVGISRQQIQFLS